MRKIKLFPLFIALLMCSSYTEAQLSVSVKWTEQTSLPATDVIYYNPAVKLNWADFRGKPVQGGNTAAVTMSGFGYSANIRTLRNKGQLNVSIYCFFDKTRSWVKPGQRTDYILSHEQQHFNLSYMAARVFMEKLLKKNLTLDNYNSILKQLYDDCIGDMNKMQDEYDSQTKNGQDETAQEKWNKLIDDKLGYL